MYTCFSLVIFDIFMIKLAAAAECTECPKLEEGHVPQCPIASNATGLLYVIRSWVRGVFVLMILLGSTWVFGFFYVNKDSLFMAYIFTILNSLQGLFIFVFHCLTNEKVGVWMDRCVGKWIPWWNVERYMYE